MRIPCLLFSAPSPFVPRHLCKVAHHEPHTTHSANPTPRVPIQSPAAPFAPLMCAPHRRQHKGRWGDGVMGRWGDRGAQHFHHFGFCHLHPGATFDHLMAVAAKGCHLASYRLPSGCPFPTLPTAKRSGLRASGHSVSSAKCWVFQGLLSVHQQAPSWTSCHTPIGNPQLQLFASVAVLVLASTD